MKVKIRVSFQSFYAYKRILYFIHDKRFERKRWHVHDSTWGWHKNTHFSMRWRHLNFHWSPYNSITVQITPLQSATLSFIGKITLVIFVPTTFCPEYLCVHYFHKLKPGPHFSIVNFQSIFKLLATIWVFVLFVQGLKYLVENGWCICFCTFFS